MIFMNKDEPNFIWKNVNALEDMQLVIESEIMEISPSKRYETITVLGRNGELHETFDDYDSYDLIIPNVSCPFERLSEVKSWLTGYSQLVTHNDIDKYRECFCSYNDPIEFSNEVGVFYTFDITFRCQPFRKKLQETPIELTKTLETYYDPGQEISMPYIELNSTGGDVVIKLNTQSLTLANTSKGFLTIDNEKKLVIQNNKLLLTKGDWLTATPGENIIECSSNVSDMVLYPRSVWL